MNKNARSLISVILFLFLFQTVVAQTNDRWREDYEAMKRFMSEAYANLEWAKNGKKINLVELDKTTREKLINAKSDKEARKILDDFLKTFQDGHLYLDKVQKKTIPIKQKPTVFSPDEPAKNVCKELGYKFKFHRFSLTFNEAPNFRLISTSKDYFPAGVFELENGKRFGVLDVGLFSADGYLGNCVASWEEFSKNLTKPCEGKCLYDFYYSTDNRLSAKLTEQLKVLQAQEIDYLIVDIGGNGGGRNWVEAAARIISPKPLKSTLAGFIRHPHWVKILQEDLKTVLKDLERKDLNKKQITYLKTAENRLKNYINEARSPCQKSNFWTSKPNQAECFFLNKTPKLTAGIFENISIKEIADLRSKTILFQASQFEYEESVFKGNLIVLVDRYTASAAENFASYIQASNSGKVIGEKTYGAGCGYVNGGTNYYLPNSKLQLRMPDCVRYRADGANEVEGIEPNQIIWETNDSKSKKLEKLLKYLSGL
jgi:hypothetical protein